MVFDLDAYLARLSLAQAPDLGDERDLASLHRAHATSIPFENLDPHRGVPVSLEVEDLQRKLVTERRGGYCFEQNLLLKAALETLGAVVEPMLARVRLGAPPGTARPRTHLVLRVRAHGQSWHADVGFGAGTLLEPLPFATESVHEQSGWRFRVVKEGEELVLQTESAEGWIDVYGFVPQPVPMVDLETSNWFTSTHPRSPFVTGLIVTTQHSDGTRIALRDWTGLAFSEQTPRRLTANPVPRQEIPKILETRFGLQGFAVDGEGRVTLAAQDEGTARPGA